jgi:hypothetical protein
VSRVSAALDAILPLLTDEDADDDFERRVDRILQVLTPKEARQLMQPYIEALFDMRGEAWAELEACASSVH